MLRLLLFSALLVLAVALLIRPDPRRLQQLLRRYWSHLAVIALVGLVAAGRLPWLLAIIAGALPLLRRVLPLLLPLVPRPGAARRSESATGEMSEDEAYRILDLSPGASEAAIRAAHKRMIQRAHPDRGGSDYWATKVNAAKNLLLERRR